MVRSVMHLRTGLAGAGYRPRRTDRRRSDSGQPVPHHHGGSFQFPGVPLVRGSVTPRGGGRPGTGAGQAVGRLPLHQCGLLGNN
jgi:hypothetical protein